MLSCLPELNDPIPIPDVDNDSLRLRLRLLAKATNNIPASSTPIHERLYSPDASSLSIGARAMNSPLGTLQDDRGGFLDAKVQPMIMVFDSKARHRQKRRPKLKKPKTIASAPAFAFINVSQLGEEDEDSRRLIKTHVMQNVLRRAEKQEAKSNPDTPPESSMPENEFFKRTCVRQTTQSMENLPQAPVSNLIVFPVQVQPYMLRLIHNCA